MKTKAEVLKAIKDGKVSQCLDGRDFSRLTAFFNPQEYEILGFELKDGAVAVKPLAWNKKNILKQLKNDLSFGFEKALNQRGISSGLMYEVVKMWMWVLNDELADFEDYAQYGLPLFKAVAIKYDMENQIGEDCGSEYKYSSEAN